jgi:uncharacterized protein
MFDDYKRDPYKRFQDSRTPPNQIHIMQDGKPRDMAELSSVVGSAEPFRICRAYLTRGDMNTEDMPSNIVRTECDRTISDKIDSIQMVRPASGRGWRRPSN